MRKIIRLDDVTSLGARVKEVAARHFQVDGIPLAMMGDLCTRPIHGDVTITYGNTRHIIDGVQVAYEGDETTCGATLEASTTCFTAE